MKEIDFWGRIAKRDRKLKGGQASESGMMDEDNTKYNVSDINNV